MRDLLGDLLGYLVWGVLYAAYFWPVLLLIAAAAGLTLEAATGVSLGRAAAEALGMLP